MQCYLKVKIERKEKKKERILGMLSPWGGGGLVNALGLPSNWFWLVGLVAVGFTS